MQAIQAMNAFNGDTRLKTNLIARAEQHRLADEYVKGAYEDDEDATTFKGCSLGCTIHDINLERGLLGCVEDHAFLADQLEIPEFLTRLQDRIFEGLNTDLSNHWTERLLTAIPVGADLTPVLPVFLLSLLDGLPPQEGEVKATIEGVKQVLIRWRETGQVDKEALEAAWTTTWAVGVVGATEVIAKIVWAARTLSARGVAQAAARTAATAVNEELAWENIADKLILLIEGGQSIRIHYDK